MLAGVVRPLVVPRCPPQHGSCSRWWPARPMACLRSARRPHAVHAAVACARTRPGRGCSQRTLYYLLLLLLLLLRSSLAEAVEGWLQDELFAYQDQIQALQAPELKAAAQLHLHPGKQARPGHLVRRRPALACGQVQYSEEAAADTCSIHMHRCS